MCTLVSAIGKLVGNARWKDIDIGNIPLNTLYSTYQKVIAVLTDPFGPDPMSLDMELIRDQVGGRFITFNDYLIELGDNALPTTNTVPVINTKYVKYADVVKAGYTLTPMSPTAADDSPVPISERTMVHLTKEGLDYSRFYRNCLVSVNGYYHYSDGNSQGIYVKDAMKTCLYSKKNQMGMLSFEDVGEITQIPITEAMIYKQSEDQEYKDACYIDLGVDYGDKQVFIVIGGYLHVLDNKILRKIGDTLYQINFRAYPLFDRYYESYTTIDLSSFGLVDVVMNETQIEVDAFLSDATIVKLLTLSQSFFVVLDSTEFFSEKIYLNRSKIPEMHITNTVPMFPMVVGHGKHANYWPVADDGLYSLNTVDTLKAKRTYNTVTPKDLPNVSDARMTDDPVNNSPAHFLVMGKDL